MKNELELRFFILRRFLLMIPTIVGITIVAFVLFRSFPNSVLAQDFINTSRAASSVPYPVLVQQAANQLGLNYPLPVQYFYFLQNFLTGQWGYVSSPITGPTIQVIWEVLPNTLQLLIFTFIVTVSIGIPIGTFIGSRPRTVADHAGNAFSLVGYAMPTFFFGLLLLLVFGAGVGKWFGAVFPIYGVISFPTSSPPPAWAINAVTGVVRSTPTHMFFFDSLLHGDFGLALNSLEHLFLPVIAISYSLLASIIIYLRAGMMDSGTEEYVKTALSKGISGKELIKYHIRKNAIIPTITSVGLFLSYVMGSLIVVETLFVYRGIGWFLAEATLKGQIYGIIYTTILFALIVVFINFIIDILYVYIDPRIRY